MVGWEGALTGAFIGVLNMSLTACVMVLGLLLAALVGAEKITTFAEDKFYQDSIVFTAASPYQRIVITRWSVYR